MHGKRVQGENHSPAGFLGFVPDGEQVWNSRVSNILAELRDLYRNAVVRLTVHAVNQ